MDTSPPRPPTSEPPLTALDATRSIREAQLQNVLFGTTFMSVILLVFLVIIQPPTPLYVGIVAAAGVAGAAWGGVQVKRWADSVESPATTRPFPWRRLGFQFVALCLILWFKDSFPWLAHLIWYGGYAAVGFLIGLSLVVWLRRARLAESNPASGT